MRIKITVIAFLFISSSCFPQHFLEEQYQYAHSLYNEKNYFDAVTEGKRLLFADTVGSYSHPGNMLIAHSYKAGGRFEDALAYFNLARKYSSGNRDDYIARLEAVKCLIILRSPSALTLLRGLEKDHTSEYDPYGSPAYWRGWYWLFRGEPGFAHEEFAKTSAGNFLSEFCDSINNEKYSVNFGRSISYLMPGSGLVYSGEYYRAFMSLLWNALGIWLTADALNSGRTLDGVLLANFVWFRFYFGGISNAQKEITNKNNELINTAIQYLETNYKGLKP